jgi:hypothetical protein
MTFEEATREAALVVRDAIAKASEKLRWGHEIDEDDLTGTVVGRIAEALDERVTGLKWDCTILRHRRGRAAEETKYGADLLIHVEMDTPTQTYSKGVLVQAKKVGPERNMSPGERARLIEQCQKMLTTTPAAFVMDYGNGVARCGSASRIAGATSFNLFKMCGWTSYRFFLELFRSPIGDTRITSALVDELPAARLLGIRAHGELSDQESSRFRPR